MSHGRHCDVVKDEVATCRRPGIGIGRGQCERIEMSEPYWLKMFRWVNLNEPEEKVKEKKEDQ